MVIHYTSPVSLQHCVTTIWCVKPFLPEMKIEVYLDITSDPPHHKQAHSEETLGNTNRDEWNVNIIYNSAFDVHVMRCVV